MSVTYDLSQKIIIIKDDLSSLYIAYKFVLIMTLASALLHVFNSLEHFTWSTYAMLLIGIIALAFLYNLVFRRTTQQKIAASDIQKLTVTHFFYKRRCYHFQLKNGKIRELPSMKTDTELMELRHTLESEGFNI